MRESVAHFDSFEVHYSGTLLITSGDKGLKK